MLTLGAASFVVAGVLFLLWLGVDHPMVAILPALVFGAASLALAGQIRRERTAASSRLLSVSRELAAAETAAGATEAH